MPKMAEYQIVWSKDLKAYEVIHTPFSFPLRDTATLHSWLRIVDTFQFCSPTGHTCTLRKEKKQRGTGYWYAYKRVGNTVHKKYLGAAQKLDLPLLEAVARSLVEPDQPQASPPRPKPQPPKTPPKRRPTLKFTKTLDSALRIYGFATIPDRKTLIARYRDLSKRYHPDTGGLHEDMVAVNLAYDYLKKLVR